MQNVVASAIIGHFTGMTALRPWLLCF